MNAIMQAYMGNAQQRAGSRFVPKPEERLLAVVHALLQRCLKLPYADMAMVPDNLRKELAGVCKACFSSVSPPFPLCLPLPFFSLSGPDCVRLMQFSV